MGALEQASGVLCCKKRSRWNILLSVQFIQYIYMLMQIFVSRGAFCTLLMMCTKGESKTKGGDIGMRRRRKDDKDIDESRNC